MVSHHVVKCDDHAHCGSGDTQKNMKIPANTVILSLMQDHIFVGYPGLHTPADFYHYYFL